MMGCVLRNALSDELVIVHCANIIEHYTNLEAPACYTPRLQPRTARYPSEYCGQRNTMVSVGVTEHSEHRKGTVKTG